ncbi:MAG: hypothetical protein ACJ79H_20850, partial [Myxococcales bacterium]
AAPLAASALRRRAPSEIRVHGEPVVAFRAPDGTVLMNGEGGPVRLAAIDRSRGGESAVGAVSGGVAPPERSDASSRRGTRLARRTGALPAPALATLRLALERTARAGGYKLPVAELLAAPDAVEVGRALPIPADDSRRRAASLAAAAFLGGGPGGKVARLVLSMPFPNPGEIHVGTDLSDALGAYLSAPVVPSAPVRAASATPPRRGILRPGPVAEAAVSRSGELHALAVMHARRAHAELATAAAFPAAMEILPALPPLLRRAVLASGEFSPGPGAPVPAPIRHLALGAPFSPPELTVAGPEETKATRPLGPGEDEIVIPMPLWTQMGRGQISFTDQVMASPVARTSYAPPLGTYTLVRPAGFHLLDADVAPPAGAPGMVELAGPTAIRLRARVQGGARADAAVGKLMLGKVPLDDGTSAVAGRGRMRVGEPLDAAAVAARRAAFQQIAPRAVPRLPTAVKVAAAQAAAPAPAGGSMAVAARSAMRIADDVEGRAMPPRPAVSPLAADAAREVRLGAPANRAPPPAGALVTAAQEGGAAGTLVAAAHEDRVAGTLVAAAQEGRAAGALVAAPSAPAAAPPDAAAGIEGLPPGAWSGARPGAAGGFVPWSYSDEPRRSAMTTVGGVSLSGVARPDVPSVPTGMRFRYAAAPLWWSSALREDDGERRAPASQRLRSGYRSANTAAAIWRSIFARSVSSTDVSGGMDHGHDGPFGALVSVERRMDVLVALGLVGSGKAAAAASGARARGPETIYVAMDEQGKAGPATGDQIRRGNALAQSVEMRIVAAIPPSPPPLQAMGSGVASHPQVLARHRHAPGAEPKAEEAVSQSRIEGSVDAIAQRIYHRIRRRIASDRERFGG